MLVLARCSKKGARGFTTLYLGKYSYVFEWNLIFFLNISILFNISIIDALQNHFKMILNNAILSSNFVDIILPNWLKDWSYVDKSAIKRIADTFSKQWIHFERSVRHPPISTILNCISLIQKLVSSWYSAILKKGKIIGDEDEN